MRAVTTCACPVAATAAAPKHAPKVLCNAHARRCGRSGHARHPAAPPECSLPELLQSSLANASGVAAAGRASYIRSLYLRIIP